MNRCLRIATAAAVLGCVSWPSPGAYALGCNVSGSPIVFGSYNALSGTDANAVGTLTYNCSSETHRLAIGLTRGYSSTFARRQMRNGANVLYYNLYLDASGTQVWGDGTGGTQMYTAPAPATGANVTVPIYGRVISGQGWAAAGGYQDNVTVILNY